MDEEIKQYRVKQILKYRKEAEQADKKAFWEMIGVGASIILIGTAHYLSTRTVPAISEGVALATEILGGVAGVTLLGESISNNSQRNISNSHANLIEDELNLDEEMAAKVIKK